MKISEFQAILDSRKADCSIFYNSDSSRSNPNLFYFSGYSGLGALVIPIKKNPFLLVPEMEFQRAKESSVKQIYSMEKKRFFESIYQTIKNNKIKTANIAIDKNNFTLNSFRHFKKQFKKTKVRDISSYCSKLREIKTEKEVQYLKKSCQYADKILINAIRNFKSFTTESEAAAFLECDTKKLGLELSFNPIVASGSNGSMPHHEPKNEKIKKGFCVVDFGVKYNGYCSDITRMVYLGNPSRKDKEIYNMLLKIQKDAINQVNENKICSELYGFVNENLGKYKKYFTHGLGHGVGVEIHEMPNLTLNSKDRIKNSMVFTIEPGIYFPGKFGIRIEDTILFNNKAIPLTKASKDLIII